MIKAIVFDFDGVLFDSEPIHFKAGNEVLEEFSGFSIPHDLYMEKYLGLTDPEVFQKFLLSKGYMANPDEIRNLIRNKIKRFKHLLQDYDTLSAIPGAPEFIEQAFKQIDKFAICSNANRPDLELVLAKLEYGSLQKYFQHIVTFDDVTAGKPEPEGYLKAARLLEIDPSHCLVIEDSKGGVRAGKRAGMTVFGLTTSHEPEDLQEADYIAKDYNEIRAWLLTKKEKP